MPWSHCGLHSDKYSIVFQYDIKIWGHVFLFSEQWALKVQSYSRTIEVQHN